VIIILLTFACVTVQTADAANYRKLTPSKSSLSFGSVTVGSSKTMSLTLTNSGNASATVSNAQITGAAFYLSGLTLPVSIPAGYSRTFSVIFKPTAAGSTSGALTITSNASNPTLHVTLSGTGITGSNLILSPSSLSFVSVAVGSTSKLPMTLKNSGTTTIQISQIQSNNSQFQPTGVTLPLNVAAGQTVTFYVAFHPSSAGSVSGTLSIESNASDSTIWAPVSGTGATTDTTSGTGGTKGTLVVSPTSMDMGTVAVGGTTSHKISLTASGGSIAVSSFSISGSGYSVSGLSFPVTIAAGQSVPATISFAPRSSGTITGAVSFNSDASNSPTAEQLTGVGVTCSTKTESYSSLQAAVNATAVGGTLCVAATTHTLTSTLVISKAMTLIGFGYNSLITGDPGNYPLIRVSGASNVQISQLQVKNTHVQSGTENNYSTVYFNPAYYSSIKNSWLTGGRSVQTYGGSHDITIANNVFTNEEDWAIGGVNTNNLTITGNTITGTFTSGVHGPPHDINLEDTDYVLIADNVITDGTGMTEGGASCIQIYPNGHESEINNVVRHNTCRKSPAGTYPGILGGGTGGGGVAYYSGMVIEDNIIDGYSAGISFGDGMSANSFRNGSVIQRNTITNSRYGIYVGGNASGGSPVDLTIANNVITGPGAVSGAMSGIRLNRLKNVKLTGNQISRNGTWGIDLEGVSYGTLSGNVVYNNGQYSTGDGIIIRSFGTSTYSTSDLFQTNQIYDNQTTKTQRYGIYITSGETNNTLTGNSVWGNKSGQIVNSGSGTSITQ
jgi:parallel beta-helix repeat protein